MRRYAVVLLSAILLSLLLASCGQFAEVEETAPTSTPTPSQDSVLPSSTDKPTPTPTQTAASQAPAVTYLDIQDLQFSDLTDMTFIFASGVGAWCTEVELFSDGTFNGAHYDSDMGSTDPDYPSGTRYYCSFSGVFSSLTKTGDYEYTMKCESIVQEGIEGEEEIDEDGIRYITSYPYGFDDADEIKIYLPGKKIDELPEGFLSWVGMPRSTNFEDMDVLPFYGLYNVAGEQGFSY